MNIKEAADNLLKKGSITQEEYNGIDFEKVAVEIAPILKSKILSNIKGFGLPFFKTISGDTKSDIFKAFAEDPDLIPIMEQSFKKGPLDKITKNINKAWIPTVALGAGVVAKEGIVDPIIQNQKINKSYSELNKYTPQLEDVDQNKIKDYFSVVKTYAPHAAANPLVAGAIINKINEFGGVDHKLILDLLNIQSGKTNNEAIKTMVSGGIKNFSAMPKED